ncbi:hypothetical protein BP6252_11170 [Coleophoma cylindrospora]|uniref:Uncharacterized protein n=1 Tax=Coleophoma cylindrospora TaxID=1849047 RepID=A0A3D8QP93_9HELO|nr:hypothetical protein BP6252_11170 [Coleophoma cylindrospora]
MALNDPREQLLANVRCLYGSDVEVLTLCVSNTPRDKYHTPRDKYQAVALRIDPLTTIWTKFLHSEPNCISSRDAIDTLLAQSERELATLLMANGSIIPFRGNMVQILTPQGGYRRDSNAGDSMASQFSNIVTPESTLPDAVPDDSTHEEHLFQVVTSKEPPADDVAAAEGVGVEEDELIPVSEAPEPLCVVPEPVSSEAQLAEQYPTEVPAERSPVEAGVEDSWIEGGCPVVEVFDAGEEPPACYSGLDAPLLEDESSRGLFTATKKNKKLGKKGKKGKKGQKLTQDEEFPPAEPEAEPAEDLGSSFPSPSKKKKKCKMSIQEEEFTPAEPEPEPEPEPAEDLGWSFSSASKKKGEPLIEEGTSPLPKLETVSDVVEGFEELKQDDPSTLPCETQPKIEDDVWETLKSEVPLEPEPVAQIRQVVVFTIKFPNETSNKPLKVMATIAENTYTAIVDTVNLYLDSKRMPSGVKGQRKVQITYGIGRDGDVDLSTLEETMWPEYLNYFRQYTRIPELTVDVMD